MQILLSLRVSTYESGFLLIWIKANVSAVCIMDQV